MIYWDKVKLLRKGLIRSKTPTVKMMTKSDGTKCANANENAEVFRGHFQNVFRRTREFDPNVIDLLDSEPIYEGLDHLPTNQEITKATLLKVSKTTPPETQDYRR